MPLYEYQCENCGDVFEVMQKFADAPLTQHATCGGKVHRLLSAPALQFKGSGWYVNDYAKSSSSGSNGSAKKDEGGSKTSADSDKKPAATPAASSSDTKSTS
jgi:putative FmdB family regulatory protein